MVVALSAIRIFETVAYLCPMPKSPFEPCIPTRGTKVPDRPDWLHEIKHDGYRLIVQRDGKRVRLFTRNGHDWSDRFPLIIEAALAQPQLSFVIDGEAVLLGVDGRSDFNGLHSRKHDAEVEFYLSWSAMARIFAGCRSAMRKTTWPGCWRGASTASAWRRSRQARSARTCFGMGLVSKPGQPIRD